MAGFDVFVITTCVIVFLLLFAISSCLMVALIKSRCKLISYGDEDEGIKKEYLGAKSNKSTKSKIFFYVLNGTLGLIFVAIFAFSIYVNVNENSFSDSAPTMRVVYSNSMSKKLDGNDYLTQNDLNDQFKMYDIILTYKIPAEEELRLYDIVVYEVDEQLVVHRIVGIEEPNAYHPNERYFTLQGDNVGNIDRYPVKYSQMRGVYRGEKIPFVGSFVMFLQSPAGYLCLALVLATVVLAPFIDSYVDKKRKLRLAIIQGATDDEFVDSNGVEDVVVTKIEEALPIIGQRLRRKSFAEKILSASEKNQEYFIQLDNALKSYKKNRANVSSKCVSYFSGRQLLAKLVLHGKTIKLFLALDVDGFEKSKYFQRDYAKIKAYSKVPFSVKIKSDRGLKNAKKLIDTLCDGKGLVKNDRFVPVDSLELIKQKYKV